VKKNWNTSLLDLFFGQDNEMPHHMNLKTKHFFLLLQDGLETTD
jgi:hypothetical protein